MSPWVPLGFTFTVALSRTMHVLGFTFHLDSPARLKLPFGMLDNSTIMFFSITGKLATMKRGMDDISQAKRETECGLSFEKFTDIQEGDVIQCCTVTVKEQEIDWHWGF